MAKARHRIGLKITKMRKLHNALIHKPWVKKEMKESIKLSLALSENLDKLRKYLGKLSQGHGLVCSGEIGSHVARELPRGWDTARASVTAVPSITALRAAPPCLPVPRLRNQPEIKDARVM